MSIRCTFICMIDAIITFFFGSKNERDVKELKPIVEKVNAKEEWATSLAKEDFPTQTLAFKERLKNGETLDDILPDAFALAREAAKRILGERAYDVQVMGSIVLHKGLIVEMKTGEGKTLMSVAAAYLNSLTGTGVHLVTVNDYLAQRDADWMRPIYSYLGVTVGSIISNMDNEARKFAYNCDITYATNNELGFDYLRDNMQLSHTQKVQRSFTFGIVDEIDSILIDEARTPLIISGQGEDDTSKFYEVDKYVGQLDEVLKNQKTGEYPDEVQGEEVIGDYKIDEKSRRVSFTDAGMLKIESILQKHNLITGTVFDSENFEYIHYFTQAVRAHTLYKIDVDYVVKERQVQIVDEFTGRILEGRRYGDGLHQAIEAKEHIRIAQRTRTLATITFQNFFRMYKKLSGMTGTADTEAVEFNKIYNLDVVVIPTNRPVARLDENDEVYLSEDEKWEAICNEIVVAHKREQPVLVGTVSIEKSEHLSNLLTRRGIRHEVLNAKNHAREALIIAEAGAKGSVTIATNMAGRGTDIKLGGNAEFRAHKRAGTEASDEQFTIAYKKEKELWLTDYEKVKVAGGLYVIGTERHESRRIDNQLRGRSGRQGDPGRSKFYISMDDELMRLFGGAKMKSTMTRIGMQPGEPIYHPWLTKGIEKAQKKVENRNFEIRKHLLDYDNVLNEQRQFIYNQRDAILIDENLKERILTTASEMLESLFTEYTLLARKKKEVAYSELLESLKQNFGYQGDTEYSESIDSVTKELNQDILEKETLAGHENLNNFIKYQYVQAIDRKWLDHLEALESLRESVSLRTYGLKTPLTEYKIDGFNIFYDMLDSIRLEIAEQLFKVKIKNAQNEDMQLKGRKITMNAQHNEINPFDSRGAKAKAAASPMASKRQAENITVIRTAPKLGRNSPCSCGSGKKYKQCCGR